MRRTPKTRLELLGGRTIQYGDERNGAFQILFGLSDLCIISSDGAGWDHVSVSLRNRCPTWEEMEYVRGIFFEDGETVIQYSPPRKERINNHPNVLHMWRKQSFTFPTPPSWMIGVKELGVTDTTEKRAEALRIVDAQIAAEEAKQK